MLTKVVWCLLRDLSMEIGKSKHCFLCNKRKRRTKCAAVVISTLEQFTGRRQTRILRDSLSTSLDKTQKSISMREIFRIAELAGVELFRRTSMVPCPQEPNVSGYARLTCWGRGTSRRIRVVQGKQRLPVSQFSHPVKLLWMWISWLRRHTWIPGIFKRTASPPSLIFVKPHSR